MSPTPNNLAEQNLIFAGLGLQLGILSKDKVIRAFTEWLFDKAVPLGQILVQQKAISQEQRVSLESAVKAHVQQEGDQEKALASLHMVKDLESDLDHLGDIDLHRTLDSAVVQRKERGLDEQFTKSRISDLPDSGKPFQFNGPEAKARDRFERQHFFDAGNLGEVYFAKDTELNRTVVAKYIKPERANESLTQALFHLEGEVTGALEHPSIVPVYGLGKDTRGRLFYAMRYIRGRKLSRVIIDYHAIPRSEPGKKQEALIDLLQYLQSACLAIEYAHKKGVLHCDIKPDNIMIGDYGEVFVVDWGLVVVHGEAASKEGHNEDEFATLEVGQIPPYRPSETASSGLHKNQGGSRRGVGGTPAYMAPEQLKATLDDDVSLIGPGSDIYALGGVLFQILTGKPPHLSKKGTKESMEDFNNRILKGDFPKPTELKPETPKALEAIALKALRLNLEDRYSSARELAEDVKRYLADEPVKAHQEGLLEKSLRFARKNRAAVGVAAAFLICLAIGGTLFGFITNGFNEKLQVSEREAKKNEALANAKEKEAGENAKIAEVRREATERLLYINKIQRVQNELNLGSQDLAYKLLASIPFQQRGWGHDFVHTRMNHNQVGLKGHTGGVTSVSFSPDGKRIVSGSSDNTLKVWDASVGTEILTLQGHSKMVTSVSFSPDGKRIVSGSQDETLKVWNATSGKEIFTLKGHRGGVSSVSFSPDGKRIVSGSSDNTLKVWDVSTGKEILTLRGHTGPVVSFSFSPDGKRIVSGSPYNNLKVWDANTGVKILTLKVDDEQIHSACFSPDGKRIASGNWDKTVKVWDASTGVEIHTLKGHTDGVTSVSFSPDGKRIASGSWDKTVKVWDATNAPESFTQFRCSGWGNVGFSPDGKKIVSDNDDNTLRVWDANSGQEILSVKNSANGLSGASFSPDGMKIVCGSSDYTLKVLDATTGQVISNFNGLTHTDGYVVRVSFSPDGKRILVSSLGGTIKVLDANTGVELLSPQREIVPESKNSCRGLATSFSRDGKMIVGAIDANTLRIWDANTCQVICDFKGHAEAVLGASFSPDGKRIVSSSMGGTLKIWDANTGVELLALKRDVSAGIVVSFSPDGKNIVSGDMDGTLKIWDATSGLEIFALQGHTREVTSVSFSPDGKRILSKGFNGDLKVLDATLKMEVLAFEGHFFKVESVGFSPDGKRIISKDSGNKTKIWDTETGTEIPVTEAELEKYNSLPLSKVSADKGWSVEADGDNVILANNKLGEQRLTWAKEKLACWAQPDPKWHSQNAEDSEKNNQWFAAAFHLYKLIELEPNNEAARKRLQVAENSLREGK